MRSAEEPNEGSDFEIVLHDLRGVSEELRTKIEISKTLAMVVIGGLLMSLLMRLHLLALNRTIKVAPSIRVPQIAMILSQIW